MSIYYDVMLYIQKYLPQIYVAAAIHVYFIKVKKNTVNV